MIVSLSKLRSIRSSNSMLLILFRIWSILAVAQSSATSQPIPASPSPSIFFFQTTHDFNKIGTSTRNTCNFIFINRGSSILKINKIKSTCGCTVPKLTKKEYKPGEGGEIKVTFTAPSRPTKTSKTIYVTTNDPNNKIVRLSIKAQAVNPVGANPEKLHLVLNKKNAGAPDITLKSINDEPFSIKKITSISDCIAIDFNPSISSSEFILKPKVDTEKLKANTKGYITIETKDISSQPVKVYYELLPEFETNPSQVNLSNIQPQKIEYKKLRVINNYNEDFEIESISSKNDYIEVKSQKEINKGFELNLKITPPLVNEKSSLSDVLHINIKDKMQLKVPCRGNYSKKKQDSIKTKKESSSKKPLVTFKANPSKLRISKAVAGNSKTVDVVVSNDSKKEFKIKSTSSKKGLVKLINTQKQEDNSLKLKLKITPPNTEHRLKVFSDTFYINLASEDEENQTRLSIPCHILVSRKGRLVR